jgi:hypothetical protein
MRAGIAIRELVPPEHFTVPLASVVKYCRDVTTWKLVVASDVARWCLRREHAMPV